MIIALLGLGRHRQVLPGQRISVLSTGQPCRPVALPYMARATIGVGDLAGWALHMRNPLQEQLLKAGLVKKGKVAQVVREQAKQRQAKTPAAADVEQVNAQQLQAERAERDRALAAERNAQARANEQRAQIRQIIESQKVKREGEISYRFTDGDAIKSLLVNPSLRAQLANGTLVIVRHEHDYELLPRAAADKVHARDPVMIVLDHGQSDVTKTAVAGEDDEYYQQFQVPDDLTW